MADNLIIFDSIRSEDEKIFERILQHDENAISELFDRYGQVLFSFLMRILRSVEEAENVLHDICVELWNNPKKFQNKADNLFCYLVTATRRRAIATERSKHLKRQNLQHTENILPIYSECVLSNESKSVVNVELLKSLITLFQQLSNEEQQIFSLGFYDGCTETEISKRLKIPLWTVNWSLRKILLSISRLIFIDEKAQDNEHKNFLEMCAGYAVGILDHPADFENHLALGCEICASELNRFETALALMPFVIPNITISHELKERIFFTIKLSDVVKASVETQVKVEDIKDVKVEGKKIDKEPKKKQWVVFVLGIVFGFLVLAGGIYIYYLRKTINTTIDDEIKTRSQLNKLLENDQRSSHILEVLKSPNVEIVHLKNVGEDKSGGKLFWDPVSRVAVLNISYLPQIEQKKNYQLWLTKGKQYISVGVLSDITDDSKDIFIRLQLPRDIARNEIITFEVSIEPIGGSVEPTGTIVLRGDVAQ